MNLHAINFHPRMPHIDLIAQYFLHWHGPYEVRVHPDGRSLEYRWDTHQTTWDRLSERDTMSYTNRALSWEREGYARLP